MANKAAPTCRERQQPAASCSGYRSSNLLIVYRTQLLSIYRSITAVIIWPTWRPWLTASTFKAGETSSISPSEIFGVFSEVLDSDFRTRLGPPPHNGQFPMHRSAASPSRATNQMPGPSVYSKVGLPGHAAVSPVGRPSSHHHTATHSPSLELGIKVAVKPEYKITSPPHLSLHAGDLPWSNFQFDFVSERKILAEAEKDSPNWSSFGVENFPT
ncbi:uncharacterized protein LOC129294551 [Prosopis cineraria]|uniref:uncharacterized protein LOC129294551 n=1 Tax=Prosopis cineraria TaxID=364024 RepID=UPI00240F5435|nr:uncharacterized protein LOC129294551 [Prosopis cineraria]